MSATESAIPGSLADVRPLAVTIAGSDSGGGAGIQADLRVFHRLGVFGTSVITAVTAQNLSGVTDVAGIDSEVVRAQLAAVMTGFAVGAAKTGMLWSREIVDVVAEAATASALPFVVDPVMVATSGARLVDESAIAGYRRSLLPHAALATPNLDEAGVLLGRELSTEQSLDSLCALAERLADELGCAILLKGGHLRGDPIDVLHGRAGVVAWTHARVTGVNTHGSGCMLSAAIAAQLARGVDLVHACEHGLSLVHDALARGLVLAGGLRLADIEGASVVSDQPGPLTRLL